MITVVSNLEQFEYDIRGLVMAFYPGESISFVVDERFEVRDDDSFEDNLDDILKCDAFKKNENTICIGICWNADGRSVSVMVIDGTEEDVYISSESYNGSRVGAKSAVKRCIYYMLSETADKNLPWGTLTGIRPTKIPMDLLERGYPTTSAIRYMLNEHLVSFEKAQLATEIAERERKLLSKIDYDRGYSLYIGIPFCPSTCLYCSFTSYPISMYKARVDEYLDCLEKEIRFTAEHFKDRHLNSIYIGGGTPTTLEPEQLDRLCTMVETSFDLSHLLEFTVEAGRPDSLTREKLLAIKKHRVDRISINPQTMKEETLKIIGRHHTVEDVKDAFYMARDVGFDNINMDLILGLPDETYEDVEHTMKEIYELSPDNLTVHSLALKRSSRLNIEHEQYEKYMYENSQVLMDLGSDYAARMGMVPYYLYRQKNMAGNLENVGYCLPDKAGLYNILIMEEKQSIVALGAGATSKAVYKDGSIKRAENVKDITQYISRIDEMIERKRELFEKD